jgi:hypothetical protein
MARRLWAAAGLALVVGSLSGCHLFCDRYCERERDHCAQVAPSRGCCAPAPAVACPAGCQPAYYPNQCP